MIAIGPWKMHDGEHRRFVLGAQGYPYRFTTTKLSCDKWTVLGFLFPLGKYFETEELAMKAADEALERRGFVSLSEERFEKLAILI